MPRAYRNLVSGGWVASTATAGIINPYSGEVVSTRPAASREEVQAAISASVTGFEAMRRLPAHRRAEALLSIRDGLKARREEFARTIVEEAGKPITDSRTEVDRAVNVLTLSAEEAGRIGGEVLPLDLTPAAAGRIGLTRRFPIGPIAAITPYNFPLNLGMHKVGPALAAGCSVIWKPSLLAPGAAFLFAELSAEAGLPPGALGVVTPSDVDAAPLVEDPRLRMLSFTGSAHVGWSLRARAGAKRAALELGGNAAVLVAEDADLDHAARRCAAGGYAYAGQVCISVQTVLVQGSVYREFLDRFVPLVRAITVGDPMSDSTQMGPMVSEKEASRVEQWIAEALSGGATLLCGGSRNGLMFEPAVLEGVRPEMKLSCEEAFGPVVAVEPYDDWRGALEKVNSSRYGLQTGLFTRNMDRVLEAWETLEVGGIIVDDVPTFRADNMPYGGVKQSGLGREGVRYAIEEMTEIRLLSLKSPL